METDGATSTSDVKDKTQKKHEYDDSYLQLGFTSVGDSSAPDVQCVLRYQTLGNGPVVPTKLQQHLLTELVDCRHTCRVFKRKCDDLKHSQTNLTSVIKVKM
jgi:hypothetical protein